MQTVAPQEMPRWFDLMRRTDVADRGTIISSGNSDITTVRGDARALVGTGTMPSMWPRQTNGPEFPAGAS